MTVITQSTHQPTNDERRDEWKAKCLRESRLLAWHACERNAYQRRHRDAVRGCPQNEDDE